MTLEVSMDLDPVPGNFHTKESAQISVEVLLNKLIPQYNPEVIIKDE